METIKHTNIIYVREIHELGGVETYVYELVKKYKDNDVAVVCKNIALEQKKRIQKYCRVYIHTNQSIECDVAIINWDKSIIDYITKDIWKQNLKENDPRGIYQGVHTDYTHPSQGVLPQDDRIKEYLVLTEEGLRQFHLLSKAQNVRVCRNPYTLEQKEKPLIIVSPTRLTKEKGSELMYKLANALDKINNNYLWFILTAKQYTNEAVFTKPNVIFIQNRLDVEKFLSMADWVVLPSKCEGDSYTLKEALYRNIPIVVRYLKYFDEYGITDGNNALFINDNNVDIIAEKMQHPLQFKFKPIEDKYNEIIIKSKSNYKEELKMKVKVRCVKKYQDVELSEKAGENVIITPKSDDKYYERIITRERAEEIIDKTKGAIEIIETIKEEVETAKLDTKKEKAIKTTKKKSK